MATETHLITQNGTSGSYWSSLTTDQKARYYYGGAYQCFATFNDWRNVLASRANLFTDLVVEIAGAWTDSSTYLTTSLSGWQRITITSKINGIYGSGFHNGTYGAGYILSFSGTADFFRVAQPNVVFDGIDVRATSASLAGSLMSLQTAASRSVVKNCFITGAGGASTVGIRVQGSDADIQNNVVVACGQYGYRLDYAVGDNVYLTNNIAYGCGTGFYINGSSAYFSVIGCIAIGNTTDWGTTVPSGRGIAAYNYGLSGQAWDNTSTRGVIALTDFINYASYDFRPATSTSPQINIIPYNVSYKSRMPTEDITGTYQRPGYVNGTTDNYDAGAYEYNWGNGNIPNMQTVTISGLVAGSRVKIKKTYGGTSLYNAIASGTSISFSYNAGVADTPIQIYIRKGSAAPYYKPLYATATISYLTGLSLAVTQIEAIAADTYDSQIATDWSINTGTKAITRNSGGQYSMQALYSWLLDYYDDSSTIDLDMPIDGITPNQFELINSGSISDGDFKYLNNGSCWDGTTLWANLTTVGTQEAGTTMRVYVDGSEYPGYWSTGNINVSLKMPNFDGTEAIDVRAREYTDYYDHWHFDGLVEGKNFAAIATSDDPNNHTNSTTVSAYGITVTVDNPANQKIDNADTAGDYTTTVDANGKTVLQVYEYLKYLTKYPSVYETANSAWDEIKVAPYGTYAGGVFFGAMGIWLKNVASADALNYVLTDNNGIEHQASAPPVSITVTNIKSSTTTCIQLYDLTNNLQLALAYVTGTSYSLEKTWAGDIDVRVRLMGFSGTTAYMFYEAQGTFSRTGMSLRADQQVDTIYNTNGVDGSTVTNVSINDGTLRVSVSTGSITWQQLYAYETYWLSTEAGIVDEGRFAVAVDPANYLWYDFKLKNTTSPTVPLVVTGGYGRNADTGAALDMIDTTGGTIIFAPDHVVAYAVGAEATVAIVQQGLTAQGYSTSRAPKLDEIGAGSGSLTTEEHDQLMKTLTKSAFIALK
jgi:hypothetical protein